MMEGFLYLYKTAFKNRLLKALHKPVTYIYLIAGVGYIGFLIFGLGSAFSQWGMANVDSFVILLSMGVLFLTPANMASYAKRKGIIFRQSDVHFVFTAPVNPKSVLIYAQVKQYLMGLVVSVMFCVLGVVLFEVAVWKMVVYFIFSFVIDNILQSSLMLILYGNERLSETAVKWISKTMYLIIGAFIVIAVGVYFKSDQSFSVVFDILSNPYLQLVPILGWSIGVIRLILMGPDTINLICAGVYLLSTCVLFLLAFKMKCTGGYYEDAMKFADDYQEVKNRSKKGAGGAMIGKKQKFRQASVQYRGNYAKAIFYRQLLEYKKSRFFIFGMTTFIALVAGGFIAFLGSSKGWEDSYVRYFIIPGVSAYIMFILSGYQTKWSKEMENPITFMIPDSPVKKLMYATLIEHIRAIIDGCLITLPGAIVMNLSPFITILTILFYALLQANRLYFSIISEALLGNILGNVGKSILKMVGQILVLSVGAVIAGLAVVFVNVEAGFLLMVVYMTVITILIMWGGSVTFSKMESLS